MKYFKKITLLLMVLGALACNKEDVLPSVSEGEVWMDGGFKYKYQNCSCRINNGNDNVWHLYPHPDGGSEPCNSMRKHPCY